MGAQIRFGIDDSALTEFDEFVSGRRRFQQKYTSIHRPSRLPRAAGQQVRNRDASGGGSFWDKHLKSFGNLFACLDIYSGDRYQWKWCYRRVVIVGGDRGDSTAVIVVLTAVQTVTVW